MFYDITLKITPQLIKDAQGNEKKSLVGHLGTHFDVMNQEFPLEYLHLPAVFFCVKGNKNIQVCDIDISQIKKGMFVGFYTGFIEDVGYGNAVYFKEHPELSKELIDILIEKEVAIIGIDCAGIRRGKEHTLTDQRCADHDVFVVENLCHLSQIVQNQSYQHCYVNTYPVNYEQITGLPCRVVAEL